MMLISAAGAYKTVLATPNVDENSPDYASTLLYKARASLALGDAKAVNTIIPEDAAGVSLPLRAVRSLAKFVITADSGASSDENDVVLEELRDLCVEVEGEEVGEVERGQVRVLAATAFARQGEVEEALETLGVGSGAENLEASALIVQIYLSIDRPDLAKREYERALKWAEDDVLLQSIEASIGLVTGGDGYSNAFSYYSEQLGNPSLTSPHLLAARGIARLLRGEISEARSDFEEVLKNGEDQETLGASVVAAGLGASKKGEAEELFAQLSSKFSTHPLVLDLAEKAALFDDAASKFQVPPLAVPTGA